MILVPCPYCGPRNASEFRWGGEIKPRPDPNSTTKAAMARLPVFQTQRGRMDHGDLVPSGRMRPIFSQRTPHGHQ